MKCSKCGMKTKLEIVHRLNHLQRAYRQLYPRGGMSNGGHAYVQVMRELEWILSEED